MNEYHKPRLIIVAGQNGAGKTSITEQLLRHEWMTGCVYVNPDLIARDQFGDWNLPSSPKLFDYFQRLLTFCADTYGMKPE